MSNSGHPKDTGQRRGLMLVISSPSGAGKTTLSRMLMEEFDGCETVCICHNA